VPDELTVGELGRTVDALRAEFRTGLSGLNARLDRLVTSEVFTMQQGHTDRRIADVARDAQSARDDVRKLEDAFEAYQLAERDKRERERQSRLYQLVVPVLFGVLSLAVAIWAVVAK
jgi:hypothetical protein